jgi:thiopeptide-type bacteriocin biosynthesis protein
VEGSSPWIAGHLHHPDLDRVVRRFVRPLVADLQAAGRLTGFFFIRYGQGGPHVRLRLRPRPGAEPLVTDRMERFAREFLVGEPSSSPDTSFLPRPFHPEVERYGGPDRIDLSLDFFTLSSVAVLDHLRGIEDVPRPARLARALDLLLRQALGFAADETELADLLRYGVDWLGPDLPKVVEKGTAVARSSRSRFLDLWDESLADTLALAARHELADLSPRDLFVLGARSLSSALDDADRATRLRIGASQIHMTGSRLGLNNAEEVYLSQIMSLTLDEARSSSLENLSELSGLRSPWTVGELLPVALATLV